MVTEIVGKIEEELKVEEKQEQKIQELIVQPSVENDLPPLEEVLASQEKMTSVFVKPIILEIIKKKGYTFKEWIEDRFFEWAYGVRDEG